MSTVTVRDARRDDARAIAAVWAVVDPHRVRSVARAAARLRRDGPAGLRTWVAEAGGRIVGTASARPLETPAVDPTQAARGGPGSGARGDGWVRPWGAPRAGVARRDVLLSVEVLPDHGSRGIGTVLLAQAVRAFGDVDHLRAVSSEDPVALAFAVRNGFLPDGEDRRSVVHTGEVAAAGPVPAGLRPCRLDTLPDLDLLADAHNAAVADPGGGPLAPVTVAALREWWDDPDAAPELSWGLLEERPDGPALVAFSLVEVDREQAAGWAGTTATVPDERGRGLATWVRRRSLGALHEAGVARAWTEVDTANHAMLAVDDRSGFRSAGRSVRVVRRVPR